MAEKDDGSLVTLIDTTLQETIFSELGARYPAVALLGEEMSHAEQCDVIKHSGGGFWVLDPLDGTTNFVAGFPFYGVSLALVNNYEPVLGVVYDPVRKELFVAQKGKGATLNGRPLGETFQTELGDCVANVDYKRLARGLSGRLVHNPPYRSQRNLGACVLEYCWLAANRCQVYLHGGQKLWDYAAGLLILTEAGGVATTFDGKPLSCSALGKQSVIAASSDQLHKLWFAWIEDANRSQSF